MSSLTKEERKKRLGLIPTDEELERMKKREKKLINSQGIQFPKFKRVHATCLVITLVFLQSVQLYGQSDTITLKMVNGTIEDVLKEIRRQTGINYLFNHEQLQKQEKMTISIKKGSVEEVLKQCLKKTFTK